MVIPAATVLEISELVTIDIYVQCKLCLEHDTDSEEGDTNVKCFARRLKKEGWTISAMRSGLVCPKCSKKLAAERAKGTG